MPRPFLAQLLLPLAVAVAPAATLAQSNVLYIVHDAAWIPEIQPLVDVRQNFDYDRETGRLWSVEVKSMAWIRATYPGPDSAAVEAYIAQRRSQCIGDLFVMLVGDANDPYHAGQEGLNHIPMRYLYDPEVAGADIGWSNYVSTDDLYGDLDGDRVLDVCVFRLPAHDANDVRAYVTKLVYLLFDQLAGAACEQFESEGLAEFPVLQALHRGWRRARTGSPAGRAPARTGAPFVHPGLRVDIVAEDADREGRSGQLVRQHGQEVAALWPSPWVVSYLGDEFPGDYLEREAHADSLDNQGHQVKISLGTIANRSNHVNFQDQRPPHNWDPSTHLEATHDYWLHIAACCGLGDIDRDEVYGRPHPERTLFYADRGSFSVLAPSRTGHQYPLFWFASEMAQRIVQANAPDAAGICVGRLWRDGKNALRASQPAHGVEWQSILGLGDPTARVVLPPPDVPTGSDTDLGSLRLDLAAAPNPCVGSTSIRYALPQGAAVDLAVFDVAGRRVRTLVRGAVEPVGIRGSVWDGRDDRGHAVASGAYFLRLRAGGVQRSMRLVRLR